jgi:hypothetical protein
MFGRAVAHVESSNGVQRVWVRWTQQQDLPRTALDMPELWTPNGEHERLLGATRQRLLLADDREAWLLGIASDSVKRSLVVAA